MIGVVHFERLCGHAGQAHRSTGVRALEHFERGSMKDLTIIRRSVECDTTGDDAEVREFQFELHHATADTGLPQTPAPDVIVEAGREREPENDGNEPDRKGRGRAQRNAQDQPVREEKNH